LGHAFSATEVILVSLNELLMDAIPSAPGIYCFLSRKETLYIGEASCLRTRLKKHLQHSDNRLLARWIWQEGIGDLRVELHMLPDNVTTKIRKAMEVELIRSRKPQFNVVGKLK